MTAQDYLKGVQIMKDGGDMPILGFGLKNRKIVKQNEKEKADFVAKKKDFRTSIENAKRLIPKYAREEREKFRQRLVDLGLETAALKARNTSLHKKSDKELYLRLEQNMNRMISQADSQIKSSDNIQQVRVLGDEYENLSDKSEHYDVVNDYAINLNKQHPDKIGSSQDATKDDLMFSTEVDTADMNFSRNQNNSMHQLKAKESRLIDDNAASTRMSDYANLSLPQNLDSDIMEQREIEEFKDVLKELITKEADNTMRLE